MTFQGDPRLAIAHWADEATRAENDEATLEAREHRSEDRLAAEARANAQRTSLFRRIGHRIGLGRNGRART